MSTFSKTLKEILLSNKLSLLTLSNALNVPSSTLYNLKKYDPTLDVAIKIVDYFNSSLDYFEGISDEINYNYNHDYQINFFGNLQNKLKSLNLPVSKFCKNLGFSETSYYRWKRGILPTYSNILSIAKYLETSIDELVGRI